MSASAMDQNSSQGKVGLSNVPPALEETVWTRALLLLLWTQSSLQVKPNKSVAPLRSFDMDAASLAITMAYCLELPRPAAVCWAWFHAVRFAMGQVWENFWLGKFDTLHFERGLEISSPWWKWYAQALPDGLCIAVGSHFSPSYHLPSPMC